MVNIFGRNEGEWRGGGLISVQSKPALYVEVGEDLCPHLFQPLLEIMPGDLL